MILKNISKVDVYEMEDGSGMNCTWLKYNGMISSNNIIFKKMLLENKLLKWKYKGLITIT